MTINIDTKSHPSKILIFISGRKAPLKLNSTDITVLRARFPGATITINNILCTYGL